jgi:hypothetical protein
MQFTTLEAYLHRPLKMRLVDNRKSQSTVCVLECRHFEVLCRADSIDANGPRTSETEVASESPKAARYLESITLQTDEDSITTGCVSWVILRAPPMEIPRGVAVDKGLVPFEIRQYRTVVTG